VNNTGLIRFIKIENEEEKMIAEQKVVRLWNLGKVIKASAGE